MLKHSLVLLLAATLGSASAAGESPWDLALLFEPTAWAPSDAVPKSGVQGLLYESLPYKGKRVQVFAYYATPEGPVPEGGWPGVVLVHGGGGTAFDAWVKRWNGRGYAAISMDLEGHLPRTQPNADNPRDRVATEHPGPSRHGVYLDFDKPLDEQWYTHAVAQVILAHSLLRSMPEVNPERTGITGISWGGMLTSTVMGLDSRFKFAVPVYGCGFLADSQGHMGKAIKDGQHKQVVNRYFDASAYLAGAAMPSLWINGTNDKHFDMPATQASVRAADGPATLRFTLEMPHGHKAGWAPEEIYAFADSVVKDGEPLARVGAIQRAGDRVSVAVDSPRGIKAVRLMVTRDDTRWPIRKWHAMPAESRGSEVSADLPADATAAYFAVTDTRGLMVSSGLFEPTQ